jgi:predicted Rossmann fold flavoprotein
LQSFDVVIAGAGAAGMMCAIEAGKRGRRVLILDHAEKPGEKIRISGGGRCNFTNIHTAPDRFISANPRFAISALSRYTPADFIALVDRHGIAHHEKTLGQLFCDGSAREIIQMLTGEMAAAGVELRLSTQIRGIEPRDGGFELSLGAEHITCNSLIIATGGKSIPKMGATGFAYEVASRFGLALTEIRPALVPLTLDEKALWRQQSLSGVSLEAVVTSGKTSFREAMLFTHRGLSGPAILQISSYWKEGQEIVIDMAPDIDIFADLVAARAAGDKHSAVTALAAHIPRRLAQLICDEAGADGAVADTSNAVFRKLAAAVKDWRFKPLGTEGYRTAEVTLGGIDTKGLDSRTLQAKAVPGLYFIGEAVDVTGWLGGYNFHWAWASGWCAGQVV